MEYKDLLRHPKWQQKRLLIFDRDGWACQECGDKETNLQVHHKRYFSNRLPWDYPDDILITLCELCHFKEEFIKKFLRSKMNVLLRDGFAPSEVIEIRDVVTRHLKSLRLRAQIDEYTEAIKHLIYA